MIGKHSSRSFGSAHGKLVFTIKGFPENLFHIEMWSNYGRGRYRISTGSYEIFHSDKWQNFSGIPADDIEIPIIDLDEFCRLSIVESMLQSTRSRSYIEFSIEKDLPYHFRPGAKRGDEVVSHERVEVERLLYYQFPNLALQISKTGNKQLYASGPDGLWLPIYTAGYNAGAVRRLLDNAREKALRDMGRSEDQTTIPAWYIEAMRVREFKDISVRKLRDVITLLQASESDTRLAKLSERQWDDLSTHPVIHVTDRNGEPLLLSLKENGGGMSINDLRAMHITSLPRTNTRYSMAALENTTPAALAMKKLIFNHYGERLFRRLAYLMAGCH